MEPRNDGHGVGALCLTIKVPPSFPEKYHKAIVRAADLCAVKKHIMDAPAFSVATKVVATA
jgi:ribosomal protein S12 methylthiotransferase accessory factor